MNNIIKGGLMVILFSPILTIAGVTFLGLDQSEPVAFVKKPVSQNPTLKKHFKTLGIKDNTVSLIYGDSPTIKGEDGSYLNGKILINPSLSEQEELQIVGHEYMHHYWQTKLSSDKKQALSADIEYAYNSDPFIPSELKTVTYENCNQSCRQEEIYAYACTALYDYHLTAKLINHCNQAIPGRHAITW